MNEKGANLPVIILSIFLVIAILIGIFIFFNSKNSNIATTSTNSQNTQGNTKSSTIKECGSNMNCFIDSARNCQKAKIMSTTNIDLFGIEQTTSSYYELKGMQSGKCLFYLRTESVDLELSDELIQQMKSDGASQAEIDRQLQDSQNLAEQLEGRDGTCKIETQKLVTLLTDWKQGKFSTEDLKNVGCSGSFFSQEL